MKKNPMEIALAEAMKKAETLFSKGKLLGNSIWTTFKNI